jgi:protein phosphatase
MANRDPGTEDLDITLPAGILAQSEPGPVSTAAYPLRYAAATHTGLVREHNEDDWTALEEFDVYVVADGMGGHNAGKVASGLCVETVRDYFRSGIRLESATDDSPELSPPSRALVESIRVANRAIFDASMRRREFAGMGTTAVAARFFGDRVVVAHAGDSRVYLARDGRFCQVTIDHSLINFLYDLNREFEAQVAEAHMSNVIMRAVGLEPDAQIDAIEFEVRPGDRLLLCTDGLSDLVPSDRMSSLLHAQELTRDEIVELLIDDALAAGGRDNVTVMLIDIGDGLEADTARGLGSDTLSLTMPTPVQTAAGASGSSTEYDDAETPVGGVLAVSDDTSEITLPEIPLPKFDDDDDDDD